MLERVWGWHRIVQRQDAGYYIPEQVRLAAAALPIDRGVTGLDQLIRHSPIALCTEIGWRTKTIQRDLWDGSLMST